VPIEIQTRLLMLSGGKADASGTTPAAATVLRLVGERTAGATGDARAVLRGLCDAIREGFDLDRAFGFRFLARSEELTPVAVPGSREESVLSARRLCLSDWPALVRAAAARQATLAGGVSGPALPAEAASELDVGELVVVPVGLAGEFTGFLVADKRSRTLELSEEELELLTAVGTVGGVLLEAACKQEQARRLGDLKSHFIALASHELRAPFAVMHGIITTLQHRAETLPDEQLAGIRNALYQQSERTCRLLEQLLDLSRLDAQAIPIERTRFSIRPRVEELVEMVVGEGKADVEIDVPPDLVVDVDPKAFDRIVSNLVVNAVRYGRAPITIAARQWDRHLRLAVEDRGGGVADEFVPRLFDPFSRGDDARGDGSGLGLSIAKSYAQAHGGELIYQTAHPHGARFELVLPRPHEDEPNEPGPR
jgi:two-component system, OmpR family, sensor histidine kinase MtrB